MTEQERREMERNTEEAIRRMREMSSRNSFQNGMPPGPSFLNMKGQNHNTSSYDIPQKKENGSLLGKLIPKGKGLNLLKMLNFNNFKIDGDISILIVVILLLSNEDSDELLLLALLYIML